jgi:hypothetical protein
MRTAAVWHMAGRSRNSDMQLINTTPGFQKCWSCVENRLRSSAVDKAALCVHHMLHLVTLHSRETPDPLLSAGHSDQADHPQSKV